MTPSKQELRTWTCEGEDGYSDETAPLAISRRDEWIDIELGDDPVDAESTGAPCVAIERRPGKWFIALSSHRGGDVNVLIHMADDGRIHIEGDGLPLASVDTRKLIPSHTMLTRPPQL